MHRGYGMYSFGTGRFIALLAIVAIAYFLIKHFGKNSYKVNEIKPPNNAINILKERYAKGEIDEKEYKEKLENLRDE
ncbi:MAG TPA: SHOCT domain-containing protein [Tissierellaceae bacterium]|nr:SHOCT domain-containing protein [Tissierellaceae bacterium]